MQPPPRAGLSLRASAPPPPPPSSLHTPCRCDGAPTSVKSAAARGACLATAAGAAVALMCALPPVATAGRGVNNARQLPVGNVRGKLAW
jgi:hypothetical protein